jgi:hypothetical protein
MDSFNFIDRPPTIRARNDYNKVIAFLVVLIMVLICLILSTILLRMVNKTQTTTKTTVAAAAADHLITKEEWRAKYKKWNDKWWDYDNGWNDVDRQADRKLGRKACLFKLFGAPFRTQTIQHTEFWYWRCSDGILQVVSNQATDDQTVNDY